MNIDIKSAIKEHILTKLLIRYVEIDYDTPLFSTNLLDSLLIAEIVLFLEDSHNITIPDELIIVENIDTINKMVDLVNRIRDEKME